MKFVKVLKASNEIWDKNYLEQNFENKWGDADEYYLVNMEGNGDYLFGIRVWPGSGYHTNGFLVRCENDDITEVLEKVGNFMKEQKIPGYYTAQEMENWVIENLEADNIDVTDKTIESYMLNEDFDENFYWTGDVWLNKENMKIKEMKHK